MATVASSPTVTRGPLREVIALFLRLGFTAFGGPAAHIAMMRQEVVTRRKWLSDEHFVDLIGVVNLIPGPNSTELGIYLGYLRAGWPGLVAAGVCFIGPAMLIVLGIAWVYVQFGTLPAVGWFLYGIKPVVVAIIAQALWGLARTVPRDWWLGLIAVAVLAGFLLGGSTIALLLVPGVLVLVITIFRQRGAAPAVMLALGRSHWVVAASGVASFSVLALFLNFLKIGAVLYGSGYVLLALLHDTFVAQLHWLTDRQLLDAISVGQFTPGPVFTTATFVGYVVGGVPGALVATLGIFLPSFVFVPLIHPLSLRLRRSPALAGFLRGVNVAALALMAGVLVELGRSALVDPLTVVVMLASLGVLLRFSFNSAWLILAGGVIGLLMRGIG